MERNAPLEAEIRRMIAEQGSLTVAEYMALCLSHPQHGYYITRDPLGRAGDFTTAPEISQMFGELIGLWAVAVWRQMGSPAPVRLIELGPGRGTMMGDVLRAAAAAPGFRPALAVHLVETSPILRQRQHDTLRGSDVPISWHRTLSEVPDGPAIVLANEFFDALPIRQAVRTPDGWRERVVLAEGSARLRFGVASEPTRMINEVINDALPQLRGAALGAIYEWRSDEADVMLARRVRQDGAALVIDYGHAQTGIGDTFQAVRAHRFADPLAAPGAADLTAHVDFAALRRTAEGQGVGVQGPLEQGELLRRLGIETRAAVLKAGSPGKAAEIDSALARLTEGGPTGMGSLFQALALFAPHVGPVPGFDPP